MKQKNKKLIEMKQKNKIHLPIKMIDGTIINAYIWTDDYNFLRCKINYPKTGKSHFASMVNLIDELFEQQHPYWALKLRYQ